MVETISLPVNKASTIFVEIPVASSVCDVTEDRPYTMKEYREHCVRSVIRGINRFYFGVREGRCT